MVPETEAERTVLDAYRSRVVVDLSGRPDEDRIVRGEFLGALLGDGAINSDAGGLGLKAVGMSVVGPVDLEGSVVNVRILLKDCVFDTRPNFVDAELRSLRLPGCILPGLDASGMRIGGNLELNEGFSALGKVDISGCVVDGDVRLARGRFRRNDDDPDPESPGGVALLASRIRVAGGLFAREMESAGQVRLISARIGGLLSFRGAKLRNPIGISLQCERIEVGESVFFQQGFRSEGRVFFQNASIAGGVDALRSYFVSSREAGSCVQFKRAKVGRNLAFTRSELHGDVNISDATIGGIVNFRLARFLGESRKLSAERVVAPVLNMRWDEPPSSIDLSAASFESVVDDPDTWPESITLDGCDYRRLSSARDVSVDERLAWLARSPGGYSPHPYEQLAASYSEAGEEERAKQVALAKQRRRRATLALPGRILGFAQDALVGYGYRNSRAFGYLTLLVAVGWVVFARYPPDAGQDAPPFHSAVYSLDLLLPVVGLDQADHYAAHGQTRWLAWALVFVGWGLTTAVVAGVARLVNRG